MGWWMRYDPPTIFIPTINDGKNFTPTPIHPGFHPPYIHFKSALYTLYILSSKTAKVADFY